MRTRSWVLAIILVAGLAVGGVCGRQGLIAAAQAQPTTPGLAIEGPIKNPVVATTAVNYTTENEEDPFNPDRIRRTRTAVTEVLLVRADGTTQVVKVGK